MTVLDPPFLKKRVAVGVNSSLWGGFPLVSVKAIEIQSSEKRYDKTVISHARPTAYSLSSYLSINIINQDQGHSLHFFYPLFNWSRPSRTELAVSLSTFFIFILLSNWVFEAPFVEKNDHEDLPLKQLLRKISLIAEANYCAWIRYSSMSCVTGVSIDNFRGYLKQAPR